MKMNAEFVHGSPLMVDHTPSADVSAGDVVVVGDICRIAHRDIAANTLGALAAGGGVYRMPKETGSSTAIAAGTKVYWDAGNSVITDAAGSLKAVGYTVAASVDGDATQLVHHVPTDPPPAGGDG